MFNMRHKISRILIDCSFFQRQKVGLGENFLTGLFPTQKLNLSLTREWETHCNVIWASFKTWLRFRDLDFMAESRACCGATMGRKATRVARRRKITLGQV